MAAEPTEPGAHYVMKSEEEVSRLSNQHEIIKDAMGGLILANIDLSTRPLRVLDSATADGTWIRDFASGYALVQHEIHGADIDPTNFPANPPAGTIYRVQDIKKSWPEDWKGTFDLVHQRLALVGAGPAQKEAVLNLAALVKPNGWIQLMEAENVFVDDQGPAMYDFVRLMKDMFIIMGAKIDLTRQIPGWLEEAGFTDIQDRLIDMKIGATNPNPRLAKQGVYSTAISATALSRFGKSLPPEKISLSQEKLDTLVTDLRTELFERGAVYPMRVVWARKKV
ncbi:S-adenosyl-L-methionine-dependent methyltransferase [Glonium stellatum]|uniref:S-adenosyl-L-methionine-dependent methyltransferase n=1 Tax=Glonium stellatum TaxID=574774 RepID=A0A8E2JYX6_9PEZI|nr:S-adenosyl-L-methionine-dependent methyltransferase [Glonium stellatum]